MQLHGFSNAVEVANSSVVFLRAIDQRSNVHVALVVVKFKVAPFKKLLLLCLELWGAVILSKVLHHVAKILEVPFSNVFAWTDGSGVIPGDSWNL